MYEIKPAKHNQLLQICMLYNSAIYYFKQNNINQWQTSGPDAESFRQDVKNGESFVVVQNNRIAATFMYSERPEPTYAQIYEGEWRVAGDYAVIHRVAVSPELKGHGIMEEIIGFAAQKAAGCGKAALRCDTHADNKPMQQALRKNGFVYSGIIFLDENKTDARLVYERLLVVSC